MSQRESAPTPPKARSRYDRPRRPFSILGAIVGLILGMGVGLLYAWVITPASQETVEPWQLDADSRASYTAAIALAYSEDDDLGRAVERLIALRFPGDPIQGVADVACQLASTGAAGSTGGLTALRAMIDLYRLQGRAGCADSLITLAGDPGTGIVEIDLPTPTVTLTAPPSKTPTPATIITTPTRIAVIPTLAPQNDFDLVGVTTACSVEASGVIIVEVYELNGSTGVPAVEVRARWNDGESRFFTGLHPNRGSSYADFQMEPGIDYLIDLPGRADPIGQPLSAVPCTTPGGDRAVITYRVLFRRSE
ncbi:MAG: hypothetical protein SGJ24_02795 [Chloroflexota bacterium]|nr:hypothetical protein [Chloroflexota bacterium]